MKLKGKHKLQVESEMENMKKGIIIYQSKYGATKKYVDWLIEKTKFDCIETPNAKIKDIER